MKLDHIGIATRAIEEALELWRDTLGLKVEVTEDVTEQGVRVAMLPLGDTHIERGAGGCLVAFVHPSSTNGVLLELVQHD